MNESILNKKLSYKLEGNKYYITLVNSKLKTKKGNEIFAPSILVANNVLDDYDHFKFKSKWLNLISSYSDFSNDKTSEQQAKDQILNYFLTDYLIYSDNEILNNKAESLLDNFSEYLNLNSKIKVISGFDKFDFNEKDNLDCVIRDLSTKQLFVSLFLTRISTSSILTLMYLLNMLNIDEFYNLAFYAELEKLSIANDDEEHKRLTIIKEELSIINSFYKD